MKQEDKDLLLQDLCARLSYNVNVNYKGEIYNVLGISYGRLILCKPFMSRTLEYCPLVEEVKLCLFPLSSMTEEQTKDFYSTIRPVVEDDLNEYSDYEEIEKSRPVTMKSIKVDVVSVNWMLRNHFDINGLIPKDLAIDATNLNVY